MDLLSELWGNGIKLNENDISLLMLATFFHDTGLTKTLDKDHGTESHLLCQDFLNRNPSLFPFDVSPALHAIELHDKKEPQLPFGGNHCMDILPILSVCDDADAYGPAGVLRYAEIYLLRGITVDALPDRVLKNMAYRFNFLLAQKWIPEKFMLRHHARYRYAEKYYKAIKENRELGKKDTVRFEIIDSYMKQVYYGNTGFMEFAASLNESTDKTKNDFGSKLFAELQQTMAIS